MSLSDKEQKLVSMSKYENLKWFKNVFVFSTIDDGYSPVPSAKIQLNEKNNSTLHSQMVFDFWNNIQVGVLSIEDILGGFAFTLFFYNLRPKMS